jgi:predicted SAM-dependent methyltransferase
MVEEMPYDEFPPQVKEQDVIIVIGALAPSVNGIEKILENVRNNIKDKGIFIICEEAPIEKIIYAEYYQLYRLLGNRLLFNRDIAKLVMTKFHEDCYQEMTIMYDLENLPLEMSEDNAEEFKEILKASPKLQSALNITNQGGVVTIDRRFIILSGTFHKIEGFSSIGWWDGEQRHGYINRNVASVIQRELFYKMVCLLAPGKEGWDMGGPGMNIGDIRVKGLNIENGNDLTADASDTPFMDNSIDFITSSHSIEHIKDTKKLFREWYRILKPRGVVGFVMPDVNYFKHRRDVEFERDDAPNEMTPEQCYEIIKEVAPGFKIVMFNTFKNNFEFEGLLIKDG